MPRPAAIPSSTAPMASANSPASRERRSCPSHVLANSCTALIPIQMRYRKLRARWTVKQNWKRRSSSIRKAVSIIPTDEFWHVRSIRQGFRSWLPIKASNLSWGSAESGMWLAMIALCLGNIGQWTILTTAFVHSSCLSHRNFTLWCKLFYWVLNHVTSCHCARIKMQRKVMLPHYVVSGCSILRLSAWYIEPILTLYARQITLGQSIKAEMRMIVSHDTLFKISHTLFSPPSQPPIIWPIFRAVTANISSITDGLRRSICRLFLRAIFDQWHSGW